MADNKAGFHYLIYHKKIKHKLNKSIAISKKENPKGLKNGFEIENILLIFNYLLLLQLLYIFNYI